MKNHFVHTPCGPVQGAAGGADGVSVFRGIRYATAGRWEYPRQVTHWDGVYDAANFGACSFQPRAFYRRAGPYRARRAERTACPYSAAYGTPRQGAGNIPGR